MIRSFFLEMDRTSIHVYDASMRKIQVLFPEPQLHQLREVARREDRPVSEIIRRATDEYLARLPPARAAGRSGTVPVFNGGRTLIGPEHFRDLAYGDRTGAGK
jgi:hypothetical protein